MTSRSRISVLVLGYNHFEDTAAKAIASIYDDPDATTWEVIVVDNGSDAVNRAAFDRARERFPHMLLHHIAENRGYPGGMNAALALATGETLVQVSSDVIVPPGMIGRLLEGFAVNPRAGMIAPVTNFAGNEQRICIETGLPEAEVIARGLAYANATDGGPRWVVAHRLDFCCVALRRAVYDRVGGFDERFNPGYFEDVDYSLRTQAAGFELLIDEGAFVYHKGWGTFGRPSDAKRALGRRNRAYLLEKHGADIPMPHERDANAACLEAYADAAEAGTPPSPTRVANRFALARHLRPKGPIKKLRYLRRLTRVRRRLAPWIPDVAAGLVPAGRA